MKLTTAVKTSIALSHAQIEWSKKHAQLCVDHFNKIGVGRYNHNKVDSNIIGTKCEVAFVDWLSPIENTVIKKCFETVGGHDTADVKLTIGNTIHNFEVKGLQEHQWRQYKRMVPPNQLRKYVENKAIVIWATTTLMSRDVILQGWNYATDIREKGKQIRTICDNIWLEHDSDMRDMESLAKLIRQ